MSRSAWQPITPGGVAGFAFFPWNRLWCIQAVFAAIASLVIAWMMSQRYFPVVRMALARFPDSTELRSGELIWKGEPALILAENPWFAILVDLKQTGDLGQVSDVQLELGSHSDRMRSILGYLPIPRLIPGSHEIGSVSFSAWWGAREPILLVMGIAVTGFGLFAVWQLLALFYAAPMRFTAFLFDRETSWQSSRKAAGAALMPGALFLSIAIVLYGSRAIPLVGLLAAFVIHFLIGWLYVLVVPFHFDRLNQSAGSGNPFSAPSSNQQTK